MSSLKDNLLVKEETLKLSAEQAELSFKNFIADFPPAKKKVLIVLAAVIIPAIVIIRVGVQYWEQYHLRGAALTARVSYSNPQAPKITGVKLINTGPGWYSAYAQIANPNLNLSADKVPYRFDFYNAAGDKTASISGTLFLLPNQQKYVVAPRVDSSERLAKGILTLGSFQWQQRLAVPEVPLKTATPIVSNELNPLQLVVEGAVVNASPYDLAGVRLVFLLYDRSNNIVGVSQRDEFNLPASGRRAYKQTWPGLYAGDIAKVEVLADTDALDRANLLPGSVPAQ